MTHYTIATQNKVVLYTINYLARFCQIRIQKLVHSFSIQEDWLIHFQFIYPVECGDYSLPITSYSMSSSLPTRMGPAVPTSKSDLSSNMSLPLFPDAGHDSLMNFLSSKDSSYNSSTPSLPKSINGPFPSTESNESVGSLSSSVNHHRYESQSERRSAPDMSKNASSSRCFSEPANMKDNEFQSFASSAKHHSYEPKVVLASTAAVEVAWPWDGNQERGYQNNNKNVKSANGRYKFHPANKTEAAAEWDHTQCCNKNTDEYSQRNPPRNHKAGKIGNGGDNTMDGVRGGKHEDAYHNDACDCNRRGNCHEVEELSNRVRQRDFDNEKENQQVNAKDKRFALRSMNTSDTYKHGGVATPVNERSPANSTSNRMHGCERNCSSPGDVVNTNACNEARNKVGEKQNNSFDKHQHGYEDNSIRHRHAQAPAGYKHAMQDLDIEREVDIDTYPKNPHRRSHGPGPTGYPNGRTDKDQVGSNDRRENYMSPNRRQYPTFEMRGNSIYDMSAKNQQFEYYQNGTGKAGDTSTIPTNETFDSSIPTIPQDDNISGRSATNSQYRRNAIGTENMSRKNDNVFRVQETYYHNSGRDQTTSFYPPRDISITEQGVIPNCGEEMAGFAEVPTYVLHPRDGNVLPRATEMNTPKASSRHPVAHLRYASEFPKFAQNSCVSEGHSGYTMSNSYAPTHTSGGTPFTIPCSETTFDSAIKKSLAEAPTFDRSIHRAHHSEPLTNTLRQVVGPSDSVAARDFKEQRNGPLRNDNDTAVSNSSGVQTPIRDNKDIMPLASTGSNVTREQDRLALLKEIRIMLEMKQKAKAMKDLDEVQLLGRHIQILTEELDRIGLNDSISAGIRVQASKEVKSVVLDTAEKNPTNGDLPKVSGSDYKNAKTIKIRAPAALKAGFEFTANVNGKAIKAIVVSASESKTNSAICYCDSRVVFCLDFKAQRRFKRGNFPYRYLPGWPIRGGEEEEEEDDSEINFEEED